MKTAHPHCVGLLTAVFSLLMAVSALSQGDPFLARTWDCAIKIPPGAYRAPKPVELKGQFEVTTSPWTLIDGITFNGTVSNQHWVVDGTIMRRVNVVGQLGIAMDAKDSVFENCGMSKTGGWFVDMFGSNWRFVNCIFTEKFMRGDLFAGDYSVRAKYCTFYDVKLPTIGVKNDPASYLQGDRMQFVNCRFIRCDVPETFLAATLDCVFEDCQFQKKRENWPAQMSSLKVTALYTGVSDPPESFLNGPLSVRFSPAPLNSDAGSTLRHSEAAGEVTLNSYNPPLEFANLGSIPRQASELVASSGDSSDAIATPAQAPAGPAIDVRSFDDLVRALPQSINLNIDGQPDVDSIDLANKWMNDHFAGRGVALPIQYGSGAAIKDPDAAFRVIGIDESVLSRGATLVGRSISLFSGDAAKALSHVAHGDDMIIRGTIKNVEIQGHGSDLVLVLTISGASVQ